MKIGGTFYFSGTRYFVCQEENKSKVKWHLISEVHLDDYMAMVRGEPLSRPRLDRGYFRSNVVEEGYIFEGIERLKVSGKLSIYRSRTILSEIMELLGQALSYGFPEDTITRNETKVTNGVLIRDFDASDNDFVFSYSKRSKLYTRIYISKGDTVLDLSDSLQIKLPPLEYKVSKKTENRKIAATSVSSLDYESLKEVLDLSFYEAPDGTILKDYKAIQTIEEFENEVMTPLVQEILAYKRRGEKLDIGLDTETTGLIFYDLSKDNPIRDKLVAIPIAWKDHQSVVVFVNMEYFENVPIDYVLDRLRTIIENEKGHIKFKIEKPKKEATAPAFVGSSAFSTDIDLDALDVDDYEWEDDNTQSEEIVEFDREDYTITGHNVIFDGRVFFSYGIQSWWDDDTLQMAFNLNPRFARGNNKLKTLTHRIFGHETPELSDILGKGNEGMYRYITDIRVAVLYGCADTDYTRLLKKELKRVTDPRMYKMYKKRDVPMLNYLYESEYYGLPVDEEAFRAEGEVVKEDMKKLTNFLHAYVGAIVDYRNKLNVIAKQFEAKLISEREFIAQKAAIVRDPSFKYEFKLSGDELRHVIYDILGYPAIKRTNPTKKHPFGQPAVDKVAMERLAEKKLDKPSNFMTVDLISSDGETVLLDKNEFNIRKYPVAYFLQVYSDLNKDWTSYFNPIINGNLEGRLYKGYNMARIETRRIANAGQTMKFKHKKKVIPMGPDWYAVNFDQASAEPRIMVSFSVDEEMKERLRNPENDYHTENAAAIKKIPPHKLAKDDRKKYKVFTLGIPYGIGEDKMTMQIHKKSNDRLLFQTRKDLAEWESRNHSILEKLKEFRAQGLEEAELTPEFREFLAKTTLNDYDTTYSKVENEVGFYRLFELDGVKGNRRLEGKITRPSGNFPIQSFAAELFRIILIRLKRACIEEGISHLVIWHMLIHDECHMSVHKSVHPFLMYKILYKACTITFPGHTTYFIGINIGNSWFDCKLDENEAPVLFVDRITKRWDAGEFRDDDYWNAEYTFINGKGKSQTEKGVKAYVLRHMREYIKERISEEVFRLQPSARTKPINLPRLLDNFENYTVRSYILMHYGTNTPLANKKDEDELYQSKFESWMIEFFGEGKEMIGMDGKLRKVNKHVDLVIDLDAVDDFSEEQLEDEAKIAGDGDYWTFDDEDVEEAAFTSYLFDGLEDEYEAYLAKFDTSKRDKAKTVADLFIADEPDRKYVEVINGQLFMKVGRSRNLPKAKEFLLANKAEQGLQVVFETVLEKQRWITVREDIDLDKIEEFAGGLVNAD